MSNLANIYIEAREKNGKWTPYYYTWSEFIPCYVDEIKERGHTGVMVYHCNCVSRRKDLILEEMWNNEERKNGLHS